MINYYHVINKWTTTDPISPGYISGIRVAYLLDEIKNGVMSDVLNRNGILEEYFDLDIYTNYANAVLALSHTGKITGFASARLPDNSVCYSLLLYADSADEEAMFADNSTLIDNLNTAKAAYMQLVKIQCETKKGIKDIDDNLFVRICLQDYVDIQELENIFLSL
jgi:hypothetical protein